MFGLSKKIDWEERGSQAASIIVVNAADLTNAVTKDAKKKIKDDKYVDIFIFNAALLLIGQDRQAFVSLKDTDRNKFSDAIYFGITTEVCKALKLEGEHWAAVAAQLNQGTTELGKYAQKLFADKDESPKGTLYWEYGKLLYQKFDLDPAIGITGGLMAAEVAINVSSQTKDWWPR